MLLERQFQSLPILDYLCKISHRGKKCHKARLLSMFQICGVQNEFQLLRTVFETLKKQKLWSVSYFFYVLHIREKGKRKKKVPSDVTIP